MNAGRVVYRVRQFWLALTATPKQQELLQARQVLSPALMRLFERMTPDEQAHALRVFNVLRSSAETAPDLLQAALLHDVGKAAQPPLKPWERAIVVLGKKCFPRAASRWGDAAPRGWRRPFVVAAQHPLWGAQLAGEAGASPTVVALIRRHQEKLSRPPQTPFEALLHKLQMADETQ